MTAPRDWVIGARRGLILVLRYADPRYDPGRHLLVVGKCRCGDVRAYRWDNLKNTPRPACPNCFKLKMAGNQNARGKQERRKSETEKSVNSSFPIEFTLVTPPQNAPPSNTNPINEREGSKKEVLCLHGFRLTVEDRAEELGLARAHCPVCRTFPKDKNKAITRLQRLYNAELSLRNLAVSRGVALTDLEAPPTPKRRASHHKDAADLGRLGKNLFYKGSPSDVEKIAAAHERDEKFGGKKRTAAGRDRVHAYQDPNIDVDPDDVYSLDALPPVHFEKEFEGLAGNPDKREIEMLAAYDDTEPTERREKLTWWVRFKRIYQDEHHKRLSGIGRKKIEGWHETIENEETLIQEFYHWVRNGGVSELAKPLLKFDEYLESQYGDLEFEEKGDADGHDHN
jgi:hypothetical protein